MFLYLFSFSFSSSSVKSEFFCFALIVLVHPSDEMWLILQKNGGMERTGDEKDDEGAGNGRGRNSTTNLFNYNTYNRFWNLTNQPSTI